MAVVDDERKCLINIRLMKAAGLYDLFDPKRAELHGYNVYRAVNHAFTSVNVAVSAACCWSAYRCLRDDYYNAIVYAMMSIVFAYNSFRISYLIGRSDAVWRCVDFTSAEFLSPGRCRRSDVLRAGRARCLGYTNVFVALWGAACVFWMISPLLINDFNRDARDAADYRLNVFNIMYPVSKEFYDGNFALFYAVECTVMAYNSYIMITFDIVIVSFLMTVGVQLEAVAVAFETFGHARPFRDTADDGETDGVDESNAVESLKSIVRDYQRVIGKTRAVYQIFRPVVLVMIAVESNVFVFQSFTLIAGLMDGRSFVSPVLLKMTVSLFVYFLHLFAVCFVLGNINKRKSDMTFSLYCCNWTEMGTEFRNVLLFAMLMNDTEKSTLKITVKKIVDLEMFSSIMHMCYSIISVMIKTIVRRRGNVVVR